MRVVGIVAWALACVLASLAVARAEDAIVDAGAPDASSPDAGVVPSIVDGAEVQEDVLTEVEVGTYVNRIREVNLHDGTFTVDFWIWFRWSGTEVLPHETFEVANGQIESRTDGSVLQDLGRNYASVRVVATVYHVFDVRSFPYDDHALAITIEDRENEDHRIRYVPDVANTAIDPDVQVAGWSVRSRPPTVASHVYRTNYGFQSLGPDAQSRYSRLTVPIELVRTSSMALFKLFWVSYLAVVLALMALRVRVTDLDARFGLGVGAIFAASANTYVVSGILPETNHITLAETVNLLAVVCIFLSLFVSVASIRLTYRGHEETSERVDRIALVGLALAYLVANVIVLFR